MRPRVHTHVLTERFGLADFRPGQEQVVEALLAGRSALAVFPTGGGQEPLLPAAGAAARRRHGRRLAADRADEGSDRLPRSAQGIDAARLDSSLDAGRGARRLRPAPRRRAEAALRRAGALQQRALPRAARARRGSRSSPSTRRTASPSGATTSGPTTSSSPQRARELGAERVLALTATATPAVVADICAGFGIDDGRRRRHRLLPAEPDAADDAGRAPASATSCWSTGCASGRPARRSST